jgi:hypothetical protein
MMAARTRWSAAGGSGRRLNGGGGGGGRHSDVAARVGSF